MSPGKSVDYLINSCFYVMHVLVCLIRLMVAVVLQMYHIPYVTEYMLDIIV